MWKGHGANGWDQWGLDNFTQGYKGWAGSQRGIQRSAEEMPSLEPEGEAEGASLSG